MRQRKRRLKLCCGVWVMILILLFPAVSLAGDPSLGTELESIAPASSLNSISNYDFDVIVGESTSLDLRVYDSNGDGYSGKVNVNIFNNSDEVVFYQAANVSQGLLTVSNLVLDEEGNYQLEVSDDYGSATLTIFAYEAKLSTIDDIPVYAKSTVKGTLTRNGEDPIARKQLTIDGTAVGVQTAITCTTLYDGSFSFTITPTQTGDVDILYQGHKIGSFSVVPAYSNQSRIGGQTGNNVDLSVAVSQTGWASARSVILTREDVLADAMVAVPYSKKVDAPILMTQTGGLDSAVWNEIQRLGAQTVYIIGGAGAVSSDAEQQLRNAGLAVVRFNGADRYETAALIGRMFGAADTVYLAYGYGEPDALAAGPYAAEQNVPILLTDKDQLTETTQSALSALNPGKIVLLGGTGVISQSLENQLSSQYSVERWGGEDRYATEQIILQNALYGKQAPVYFASAYVTAADVTSGKPYGDALLAAALAAKKKGYLVTLPPTMLPQTINYALLYNKGYIRSGAVVGNSSAISVKLEQQLNTILAH